MLQGEYGFEALDALLFADVCDYGFHVFWGQPFDGWHVTEGAMMGARPVLDCEQERSVGVVARLVHLREV